jgi:hypothetical protein
LRKDYRRRELSGELRTKKIARKTRATMKILRDSDYNTLETGHVRRQLRRSGKF